MRNLTAVVLLALLLRSPAMEVSSPDFCYNEDHCKLICAANESKTNFSTQYPTQFVSTRNRTREPMAWGDTFLACMPVVNAHHSPINLDSKMIRNESLGNFNFIGYQIAQYDPWMMGNTRDAIVVKFQDGMKVDGPLLEGSYKTLEMKFHWGNEVRNGSEHTFNRRQFPMEIQILSINSKYPNKETALQHQDGTSIIAVFIDVGGADNQNFEEICGTIPIIAYPGQTKSIQPIPLLEFLPRRNLTQFYLYRGGLTVPPCAQTVQWTVFEVPILISQAQYQRFVSGVFYSDEGEEPKKLLQANFRHIHATFSRRVIASREATIITASSGVVFACSPLLILILLILFPLFFVAGYLLLLWLQSHI